jgi:hypothetical protein
MPQLRGNEPILGLNIKPSQATTKVMLDILKLILP